MAQIYINFYDIFSCLIKKYQLSSSHKILLWGRPRAHHVPEITLCEKKCKQVEENAVRNLLYDIKDILSLECLWWHYVQRKTIPLTRSFKWMPTTWLVYLSPPTKAPTTIVKLYCTDAKFQMHRRALRPRSTNQFSSKPWHTQGGINKSFSERVVSPGFSHLEQEHIIFT